MEEVSESPSVSPDYIVRDKWYNCHSFSLVPYLRTRKADERNESWFSFDWLFLRVWSKVSMGLEAAFVCDTHWGIGFTFSLPYLRIVFCIPCPQSLGTWSQRNLWRKPKK